MSICGTTARSCCRRSSQRCVWVSRCLSSAPSLWGDEGIGQGWVWGQPGGRGKRKHKPPGHGPTHPPPRYPVRSLPNPHPILSCPPTPTGPGCPLRMLEHEGVTFHLSHALLFQHSAFCAYLLLQQNCRRQNVITPASDDDEALLGARGSARGFTYIIANPLYGPAREVLLVPPWRRVH